MTDKKTLKPSDAGVPVSRSASAEISAFLRDARSLAAARQAGGRLILALDATMSRQPTWDLACRLQADMFDAVAKASGLSIQLAYFRGFDECRNSKFVTDTDALKRLMSGIDCRGGHTQIGKVLTHALKANAEQKVSAVVYIGDAVEEAIDDLAEKAGRLGLHGVPVFVFQEGQDGTAERALREIARLSKGAWFRFDRSSAARLASLLSSVAVYATGGLAALEARDRPEDRLMIENLRGGRTG